MSIFTRHDVTIPLADITLDGWFYRPITTTGPTPVIVMSGGYATVKELYTDRFAECFAAAGLAVLLYDHRNFGKSGGTVRGEIDPWQQVRDMQDVITWVGQQNGIDAERIGLWGSSYSGGHALLLGAMDRRLAAIVVQVPTTSGFASAQRRVAPHLLRQVQAAQAADRAARAQGQPVARRLIIPADGEPGIYNGADAVAFYGATATLAPHWENAVTVRSAELSSHYDPAYCIERISPTPLLMIVAAADDVTPTDLALSAYQRALEPKKLVLTPGGHFDVYHHLFEQTSGEACDWFTRHLKP